jgi:hypothetical protein
MTFEEFQATRRYCENIGALIVEARHDDEPLPVKGNLYLRDSLYIEEVQPHWPENAKAEGRWHLLLGRDEWITNDLESLERKLYDWAVSEDYEMTSMAELEKLAEAAKPLDDDEWGSPRQVEAQNLFFDTVQEMTSDEVFEGLSNYCLKADVYEMIEAGLQAARGDRDFAEWSAPISKDEAIALVCRIAANWADCEQERFDYQVTSHDSDVQCVVIAAQTGLMLKDVLEVRDLWRALKTLGQPVN